jgi:16S rRNA (cytosine1402-N4)-methyltransferase
VHPDLRHLPPPLGTPPREEERPKLVRILTKKPALPGADELKQNSRSRSAKLRVVEKLP